MKVYKEIKHYILALFLIICASIMGILVALIHSDYMLPLVIIMIVYNTLMAILRETNGN